MIFSVYTDEYSAYNLLDGFCNHQTVNHSLGEYARDGGVHTNTVEAEFSVFRPWIDSNQPTSKHGERVMYCQINMSDVSICAEISKRTRGRWMKELAKILEEEYEEENE